MCTTPATHAGVYEYTATFSACAEFFWRAEAGRERVDDLRDHEHASSANANDCTANPRPLPIGQRKVPKGPSDCPTSE